MPEETNMTGRWETSTGMSRCSSRTFPLRSNRQWRILVSPKCHAVPPRIRGKLEGLQKHVSMLFGMIKTYIALIDTAGQARRSSRSPIRQ